MLSTNVPKNYSLYEVSYGTDLPTNQLYLIIFNELPSRHSNKIIYDIGVIDYFKNNGYVRCNICDVDHYSKYTNEMGQ